MEFAELLQLVAEAALAAASPSGRSQTDQWWELLFLLPRLLLAALAKETAGRRGQAHALLTHLVAMRFAKLRNGDWSELCRA